MLRIPDAAVASTFAYQADVFSVDIDALVAGFEGTGVRAGCQVTAQATPNMTVKISAGCLQVGGRTGWLLPVASQAIAGASANPRIDIVVAVLAPGSITPTISVVSGTATNPAVSDPPMPPIPTNGVLLASIAVGTSTTTITNGPPGNIIDKRVPLAGALQGDWIDASRYAIADGSTNNNAGFAAAVTAVPVDGTLYFPNGDYRGQLIINRDRITIVGSPGAQIRADTADMCCKIGYNIHFVTIRGMRFHGNAQHGGVDIGGGGGSTILNDNIVVEFCEFTQNAPDGAGGSYRTYAINSHYGPNNGAFRFNRFYNSGGGGINAFNLTNSQIIGNRFENVGYGNGALDSTNTSTLRQDLIYINGEPTPNFGIAVGKNVIIAANVGNKCHRNAIEIQSNIYEGLLVVFNSIRWVENHAYTNETFSISAPNCPRANISYNDLTMPGALPTQNTSGAQADTPNVTPNNSAGIEMFQGQATCEGNTIFGHQMGIVLTGVPPSGNHVLLRGNRVTQADWGIVFGNDVGKDYHDADLIDNEVIDCRSLGIYVNSVTVWGGLRVQGGRITRNLAWAGDSGRSFSAFGSSNMGDRYFEIRDVIFELGASVSLGGGYVGIDFGSGASSFRSVVDRCRFEWFGASTSGQGIHCWANHQDLRITNCTFTKMATAVAGLSATTRGVWSGNINDGSGESGTPSGFWGSGVAPIAPSITPTFKYCIGHAAAIPSSGTFNAGDYMYFSAPAAAAWMGAVCVTAGSPGTWKRWGAIEA